MLPVGNMETLIFIYMYDFYSHGWDVFTCQNIFTLAHMSSIPMGAMFLYM